MARLILTVWPSLLSLFSRLLTSSLYFQIFAGLITASDMSEDQDEDDDDSDIIEVDAPSSSKVKSQHINKRPKSVSKGSKVVKMTYFSKDNDEKPKYRSGKGSHRH